MKVYIGLILLYLLECVINSNLKDSLSQKNLQKTITQIYKNLLNEQAKKEVSFRSFPPRYAENKGMFRSYIHINAIDDYNSFVSTFSRNYIKVTDMNMFVSNFAVTALLECHDLGSVDLDKEAIKNALAGILDFKDKNYPETTPIYTFWKQINANGTWSQCPDTMYHIVSNFPNIPDSVINTLTYIGLGKVAEALKTFSGLAQGFMYAYRIPSDADDTSVNMALTGRIHKMKETLGDVANDWLKTNTDFEALFKTLKYFSYRPFLNFTKDHERNETSAFADLLDPRSYYPFRGFLEKRYNESIRNGEVPNVILPGTWIFDYDHQKVYFPTISMPFNLNNVDLNVASNFVFGLTNLISYHANSTYINSIFDNTMKKMYMDTIDLFVWSLETDLVMTRPDVALLYYPSKYDFYWLVSRTYNLIKTERLTSRNNKDQDDFFNAVEAKLEKVLKEVATPQIVKHVQEKGNYDFFTEFLGNYNNYTRNEDATFASSLALNSLLNTWTDLNKNKEMEFSPDTPKNVRDIIDHLALYLVENVNSYWTSLEGAFFSGSVKSYMTMAYFYPQNFYEYLNGTYVPPYHNNSQVIDATYTGGVKGFIQKDEYDKMANDTYYGVKVPAKFKGFNVSPFPYWSSPAITYSTSMIALTKYKLVTK